MQKLPHVYRVEAQGEAQGEVIVSSPGLVSLATNAPAEFGGPGDRWSPETLLVGAVADCFILSFRAVAKASGFAWEGLECDVDGVLDRVEGVTRFTELRLRPRLTLSADADSEQALRLLEKAKKICLISNSMTAVCSLEPTITAAA